MQKPVSFVVVTLLMAACATVQAHGWKSSEQMAQAAHDLLAALEPAQRDAVRFPLDAAERGSWSNLPIVMVPPSGLLMTDMNDRQRAAVQALLRASMSSQGYAKITSVMRLDEVLREEAQARWEATPENQRTPLQKAVLETRDPNHYAIAIFGDPDSANWGWRIAGHHAAANFTVADGRVAFTPTFLGSSPRVLANGPYAGLMALPQEGNRGIELMQALTPAQQQKARVAEELISEIVFGAGRQDGLSSFEGLSAAEFEPRQKRLLRALVEEYVRNADFDAADAQLKVIEDAGWDALWFSWRGPIESNGRFYYRVHGPRLLIEYVRVDDNHDHSIVRDPANDYGADWLQQHIKEHHPTTEQIRNEVRERFGVELPE